MQRRRSASFSSRVRLEVSTTTGAAGGPHRADLGDRDRVVGEELEQERLEFVVGAVDLVDEEHARLRLAERSQQRPLDQEILGVEVGRLAGDLRLADGEQLARVVPLVERLPGVDPLVALQPDEVAAERGASALAASVLPTPGTPSTSSGLPSASARKTATASPSSAR